VRACWTQKNLSPEGHQPLGDSIKSVVYGGLDGVLTSFAICSGAAGSGMASHIILVLGFSGACANGLAMGLGDALSTRAENEHALTERQRELWEYDNYPQGEVNEMIDLYVERGMAYEDAKRVIELMAEHRNFFVDVMTVEELGLQLPKDDDNPFKDGAITCLSFLVFATIPLVGFVIFPWLDPALSPAALYRLACLVTGITLFVLGTVSSSFSAKPWYRGGLEMVGCGSVVALLAYVVGAAAHTAVGLDASGKDDGFGGP